MPGCFQEFDAIGTVEGDIEDHNVGLQAGRSHASPPAPLGLAADLQILLLVDEERESLAHEGMVVDNKDRLFGGCTGLS